jgi:prenyltransferase beta subunit
MNTEEVIARLKSVPPVAVSHDLAPEILAKVRAKRTVRVNFWRLVIPLAAAATVALLLGGMWLEGAHPPDSGRQAVEWLSRTQEADGSWSTTRWGGDKQFEVALTGLALLTLVDESSRWTPHARLRQNYGGQAGWRHGLAWLLDWPDRARRSRSTEAAIAYLIRKQGNDGQFGEFFSSAPYNQGIATLALAKAYETRKDESLRVALNRAVSAICACQHADGGWGYHQEARPASNLSVTLWQIEALRLASAQGWPQVRSNVERGFRWMAGVAADNGSFGYRTSGDAAGDASPTLTAMGAMSLLDPAHMGLVTPGRRQAIKAQVQRLAASPGPDMDFYRRYFLAAALKKMDESPSSGGLVSLRRDLLSKQVKRGKEAGSWKADTQWGSAGGRIYSTALASLSLR